MNRHSESICMALVALMLLGSAPVGRAAEGEEEDGKLTSEIAPTLRKHCVRVRLFARKDEGEAPPVGSLAQDVREERPTLWGGYLWDETTVIVADPVLHDRFIRRIEVEASGKTVAATVKGYLVHHQSLLLTLAEALPGVEPIVFADPPARKDWGKLRSVRYEWERGRWELNVGGAVMGYVFVDEETGHLAGKQPGLLVDPDGGIVGISFGGRLSTAGQEYPWKGQDLRKLQLLTVDAKQQKLETIRARLRQAALEVQFAFRAEVEEEESHDWRSRRFQRDDDSEAELTATGFLVSPQRLLVPVDVPREMVAKLESIVVRLPPKEDGAAPTEREARFVGAFKDVHAILIDVAGDPLPGALALAPKDGFQRGELFLKANIDYSHKQRKEQLAYDRFRGYFRTYADMPGVWTFTNEDDGSIAFSLDGEVLAISLAHRPKPTGEQYSYHRDASSMFRPLRVVTELLAQKDAIDETNRPVEKQQEKRLITLGVEWQKLDVNLAKAFRAEEETRGGEIGLLVTHVYPGSAAKAAGLQPEDILLRIKDPDRAEPIDLKAGYSMDGFGFLSHMGNIPEEARAQFMNRMPSPWPSRQNVLTQLLTDIGEGKTVRVDSVRDGEAKQFTFETEKGPPDFRSAAKHKSKKLGLTVKALTYEVKRFFQREDEPGVIASKVEPGGKAAVARIGKYQLITHVNKQQVTGLEDFKKKIAPLEQGERPTIEFTIWYMGRTRIVKIEL